MADETIHPNAEIIPKMSTAPCQRCSFVCNVMLTSPEHALVNVVIVRFRTIDSKDDEGDHE